MKRKIVLISLILPLLLAMIGQFAAPVSAKVIRVPEDHKRVQWAVGNASEGDVIQVAAGIYYESDITINKSLTLIGENSKTTIIDANETSRVFKVAANNVTISGFTIRNTLLFYGISLYNSRFCKISDTIIMNNWIGIYMSWCNSNTIRNNVMINNQYNMRLYASNDNKIRGNALVGLFYGIYLHNGSNGNHIINNVISKNDWYGVWLDDSNSNLIHHNNFVHNTLNQTHGNSLKANVWNNSAGRGNYWNDYKGVDDGSGGRVPGDGVGDTNLPHLGIDNYPLMVPWGDLNDDNIIDESDLNIAAVYFGTYVTEREYNPRIDLNSDDIINIFDIVIIAVNYKRTMTI